MSYLDLENITKSFGDFIANDNINLNIEIGVIHAILGENGAGKSTLMNIISGIYQPDSGRILINKNPIKISSPAIAIKLGIGMIHQHFMLIPQLTVTENIILGTDNNLHLNLREKQAEIAKLSQLYNLEIDPTAKVENLPVGMQQRVEIIKVLYRQAKLLILDEPTAVLTPLEVRSLINILRQLAANGHTIIFISHKLEEVIELCDRVTVLRGGKVVASTTTKETTPQQLADLMIGKAINLQLERKPVTSGEIVLSVQNLQVVGDQGVTAVKNISFELRQGEILGVAGVDGNGQRELADAICGLRKIKKGKISPSPNPSLVSTREEKLRLAYIPEDRQKNGLVMEFDISQNLILKLFKKLPFSRYGFLQRDVIKNNAISAITEFDIRVNDIHIKARQLSGGNQQKIILARELSGEPELIVAMQPTRGLDIGATEAVRRRLLAEKQRGAAILYISTELEEIMTMSDRIAVIYRGEFIGMLDAAMATVEEIGLLMSGVKIS
ncbi:ABC transporter ATP-binding protein [Calothrix sp. 336/3]|uniref:ABC transporter ATP-binding protein n=1 Tax=Calothrix sp. 336/3 TaxID=1337936 RepID=UPI0004E3FAB8|nr:ABC transporter ATP-binding protein [Calothrix sp. 336/3]AKG24868.1 heme ABC transporter ATP-binding protein [Calothrix sp. 336/3]